MFSCCLIPFLIGLGLGWILNWLLCKFFKCCSSKTNTVTTTNPVANVELEPKPVALAASAAPVAKATPVAPAVKAFVLDTTAAKAAGFKLRNPDDLTVIEGIGPKINELFNNAGFHTFAQVSKMSAAQMQKILDDAGPKFRLAKPSTWAKQAALANENKWAELKTMQDNLKGGV